MSTSRKFWGDEQRAYQKGRRDKARAAGLCIQCCARRIVDGLSRCAECRAKMRDHKSRRDALRPVHAPLTTAWCDECCAAGFHRADCRADLPRPNRE